MTSQNQQLFDGETGFMDAHDILQAKAGNATWLNEFLPVVEGSKKHIAEVLLWMAHTLGLCCVIAGDYAMYLAGKLASQPDLITMYISYYPQEWTSDTSVLLQFRHTSAFCFGNLEFLYMQEYSAPGKNIYYTIKCGDVITAFRIVCVQSAKLCSPRSNIDFTQYVWSTFDYYCANYAMFVLPSHTSDSKIVYVSHVKAQLNAEGNRLCGNCVCNTEDPRMHFDFGCRKPNNCNCTLCNKQPLSLKTLASEIVFGLYNKNKFRFDNKITCKPVEIPADFVEFIFF